MISTVSFVWEFMSRNLTANKLFPWSPTHSMNRYNPVIICSLFAWNCAYKLCLKLFLLNHSSLRNFVDLSNLIRQCFPIPHSFFSTDSRDGLLPNPRRNDHWLEIRRSDKLFCMVYAEAKHCRNLRFHVPYVSISSHVMNLTNKEYSIFQLFPIYKL